MSAPLPPLIVSAPIPPRMMSLPSRPSIVSLPPSPRITSSPSVPTIVQPARTRRTRPRRQQLGRGRGSHRRRPSRAASLVAGQRLSDSEAAARSLPMAASRTGRWRARPEATTGRRKLARADHASTGLVGAAWVLPLREPCPGRGVLGGVPSKSRRSSRRTACWLSGSGCLWRGRVGLGEKRRSGLLTGGERGLRAGPPRRRPGPLVGSPCRCRVGGLTG